MPLTAEDTYVFPAKLVGDNVIPGRYYKMSANFLQKMSDQAKEGVSLLLDHSWSNWGVMTIPIGRTFDSRLQRDGTELALYADHYMKLGQEFGGIRTDQIADGIDAGTIFDTSIGFVGTKQICGICGNDYFDYESCQHIRGQTYDGKICIVTIDDGYLMENSLVFDGAYPGAGIVAQSGSGGAGTSSAPVRLEALKGDAKSLPNDRRVFYSLSAKTGMMSEYVLKAGAASMPEQALATSEQEPPEEANPQSQGGQMQMTLEELKAQYPEAFAAAVQEGVTQERARLMSIDELLMPGNEAIISQAKTSGASAADTAVAILKAENAKRKEMGNKLQADADKSNVNKLAAGSAQADEEEDTETQAKALSGGIIAQMKKLRGEK